MPDYPLSRQGVFRTLQGEGALLGLPMVFVRLAGCSVGCPECDTDYRVHERASVEEIASRISQNTWGGIEWVWLTGGEPTDHDLRPLIAGLHAMGLRVALATAGTRLVPRGWIRSGADFLSVSPHDPARWVQRSGDQINLVPGLNGLSLRDPALIDAVARCEQDFSHRYVTPLSTDVGLLGLNDCRRWIDTRPGWRLSIQAHKEWQLP